MGYEFVSDQKLEQEQAESAECDVCGCYFCFDIADQLFFKKGVGNMCEDCCYENGIIGYKEYRDLIVGNY